MTTRSPLLDLSSSGARASMNDVERHPASDIGDTMRTEGSVAVRARAGARSYKPEVDRDVRALSEMRVPDLEQKYLELYGVPTHSRNRQYLIKRLTWRIQELAYGGLKPETRKRIEALGEQFADRNITRRRIRDDVMPIAGTRLLREWQGVEHAVTVMIEGYEWQGRPYRSLSAIARAITGTRWNGPLFFGIRNHRRAA